MEHILSVPPTGRLKYSEKSLENKITDPVIEYMKLYKTPLLEEIPTKNSPQPSDFPLTLDRHLSILLIKLE